MIPLSPAPGSEFSPILHLLSALIQLARNRKNTHLRRRIHKNLQQLPPQILLPLPLQLLFQ